MRHFNDYDTQHVAYLIGDLATVKTCEVSRLDSGDFFLIWIMVDGKLEYEIHSISDFRLKMRVFVVNHGKRDPTGRAEHNEKFGMLDNAVARVIELLKERSCTKTHT